MFLEQEVSIGGGIDGQLCASGMFCTYLRLLEMVSGNNATYALICHGISIPILKSKNA
jgi:hypothetical protein